MSEDGSQKKATPYAGPSPSGTPEQRSPETLPSDVNPTVFQQEDPAQPSRHLTPEAAGIEVKNRPGQTSQRVEQDQYPHTVGGQSEAWWTENRDKRPLKKAETK